MDNEEDEDTRSHRDREITLGTTTLLGIFFGLAILCATFFGFGYSMGSKHTVATVSPNGDPVVLRNLTGGKPSSGNPYAAPQVGSQPGKSDSSGGGTPYVPPPVAVKTAPLPPPGTTAPPEAFETTEASTSAAAKTVKTSAMPTPAPSAALVVATPATTAAANGQQFVVQVAALSHQDDAEMIQTTLKRRGYAVVIRPDAGDHLLHVQVGPFGTRKDAEAMRQKLLGDGFNAYIK